MITPRSFRDLGTLDVVAYLRSRGWAQEPGTPSEPLLAWTRELEGEAYELLVPRHKNWRDYDRRIAEVLSILTEAEQRSAEVIARDIASVAIDTIRVRAITDSNSASIPLEDGLLLLEGARGSILAAACATIEKRRAYHSRKPVKAVDYLEGIRLGQSEVGSYVMTILSPVPPSLNTRQLSLTEDAPDPDPYERQVTRTLGQSLDAMRIAAEASVATGSLDAFESSVSLGVNADLCEAVAKIADAHRVVDVGFEIGYAPSRPVPLSLPRSTHFTADMIRVVAEAGRLLREKTPDEDFELIGSVIKVTRPSDTLSGTAVVLGLVSSGEARKVSVELWGSDWEIAYRALNDRALFFRCVGELHRAGRGFALRNPRSVEVFTPEDP